MQREINPPEEIIKRLLFVLYLFVSIVFVIAGLLAAVQQRVDYLRIALLAGGIAISLHVTGKRYLDFERLSGSFPYGAEILDHDLELYQEVKKILADAASVDGDWQQRQKLRTRLVSLLEANPQLWQEFEREIYEVFPALQDWIGKSIVGR